MKTNNENFWDELSGVRLKFLLRLGFWLFILLVIVSLLAERCSRPVPNPVCNPWRNYDPGRPLTDVSEYDYERRLIIYRDEKPLRSHRNFNWDFENNPYEDSESYYGDHYEDIYEYFHD